MDEEPIDPLEFAKYCRCYDDGCEADMELPPEKAMLYDEFRQFLETAFAKKVSPSEIIFKSAAAFGVGEDFFFRTLLEGEAVRSETFAEMFDGNEYLTEFFEDGRFFGDSRARALVDDKILLERAMDFDCGRMPGAAKLFRTWFGKKE